jgi:hypothetical protein
MLENYPLENILFLDIETVPAYPDFQSLPEEFKFLWDKKSSRFREEGDTAESVYQRAGIYAEFGKIICISVGVLHPVDGLYHFRIKSFAGENEKDFLPDFIKMVNAACEKKEINLCAHNGKEFDFPYIARRILVNGLKLPPILNVPGLKPWEVKFLDTMELWKFGDHKHYTSLELLTRLFNIPSPKDDIDGSMVATVFYEEKDLPRVVKYCENDVVAIAQLFLRYRGLDLILPEHVTSVT